MITVTAAVLSKDNKILLARRNSETKHAGKWEFPGGKMEQGESVEQCLIREIKEELGIAIASADLTPAAFAQSDGEGDQSQIVILLYTLLRWVGEPQALEGGEVDWFTPGQIAELAKPPLDIALAAQLFGHSGQ